MDATEEGAEEGPGEEVVSLAGVKVGDDVVVWSINSGTARARVDSVGRKYATIGRYKYDIETGQGADKDYGFHRCAYTLAAWSRQVALRQLRDTISALRDVRIAATLSEADVAALTADVEAIARRLEGK